MKDNYRLLFTEINNTAQTEGKLITALKYFCLINFEFASCEKRDVFLSQFVFHNPSVIR